MRKRLFFYFYLFLAVQSLFATFRGFAADISANPGDTGSVQFTINNSSDSTADLDDTSIYITVPDELQDEFVVDSVTSDLSPVNIAPGDSNTFNINYEIDDDAPGGTYTVQVYVKSNSVLVDPPVDQLAASFSVSINAPTPTPDSDETEPEDMPDTTTAEGVSQIETDDVEHLNEPSSTSAVITISFPQINLFGATISVPSFSLTVPDLPFDPVDALSSLNSIGNISPNNLASKAIAALPGGGDINSLIGSFTCGGGLTNLVPGLAGPLSQISSFIHTQMGPLNNAIASLPPQVQQAVHVQMISSGAGAVMAKDYLAQGRNNQLAGVDADLNTVMASVDRFVSVDAPFLGENPKVEQELNEIKKLLASGQSVASAALAILAPTPQTTQTGAMGSGMSLGEIVKFVKQLADLRCDINNLAGQWSQFAESQPELLNGIAQTVPGAALQSGAKAIDYHLLSNIGIPTELPNVDATLLSAYGSLAQSGNLGSILSAVDAINDPEKMLHIVEGVLAKNPVTSGGSGVVGEFSALAGLNGPQPGAMRQPVNMFNDQQVYKDPNDPDAFRQATAAARAVTNLMLGNGDELSQALQALSLPLYIPGIGQAYAPIFTPISSALNFAETAEGYLKNLLKLQAFQNPNGANPDEPTKELFDNPQIEILRVRASSSPTLSIPVSLGMNDPNYAVSYTAPVSYLMDPASATSDPAFLPVQSTSAFDLSQGNATTAVPIMDPKGVILYPDTVFYNRKPVEIRGILRDYSPGQMKVFEMSMNYSFPYTDLLSTNPAAHTSTAGNSDQGRDPNSISTASGGLSPVLIDPSSGYFVISADPNSPFFVNDFNFLEGQNEIVFHTIDWAGKESFQRIRFVVSTLPFYIVANSPSNNEVVNGSPSRFSNLIDVASIPVITEPTGNTVAVVYSSFKIFPDGQPPSQNFIVSAPQAFHQLAVTYGSPAFRTDTSLVVDPRQLLTDANGNTLSPTASIPEGMYDVQVAAYSPFTGINNITQSQYSFMVDNTPPTLQWLSPASPITIQAPGSYSSNGTFTNGVSEVLPGYVNPYSGMPATYSGPVTLDAIYSVTDNLSPLVKAISFAAGTFNFSPPAGFSVSTPPALPFESQGSYTAPLVIQNLPAGSVVEMAVTLAGADSAGNTASAAMTLYLDRLTPVPAISTPTQTHLAGSTNLSPSASVVNSATLAENYPYSVGPTGIEQSGGTAIFHFTDPIQGTNFDFPQETVQSGNQFDLEYTLGSPSALPDGIYNVSLTAVDPAGNSATGQSTLQLTVDRTPPILTAVECLPFEVPAASPNVSVFYNLNENADAPELNSGNSNSQIPAPTVSAVVINSVGGSVTTLSALPNSFSQTNQFNIALPNGSPSGQYSVSITATDWANNQTSYVASFVYQSIPPAITSPITNQVLPQATIVIQGTATAPNWNLPTSFKDYRLYYYTSLNQPSLSSLTDSALTSAGWQTAQMKVPTAFLNHSAPVSYESVQPVVGGTLAYLNTAGMSTNSLWILLVAEDQYVDAAGVTHVDTMYTEVEPKVAGTAAQPISVILNPPAAPNSASVSFSPDPHDPNNAVTFNYGLIGQNANTRFEVLDPTGRSVFTRTQNNVTATAINFFGQPAIPTSPTLGYYLWYDAAGWHIRFQSDGQQHLFGASIAATGGDVLNVTPVNLENVNQDPSSAANVDQLFPAANQSSPFVSLSATRPAGDTTLSGFDWQMAATSSTLTLSIDGVQQDSLVNIGSNSAHPSALPGIATGQVLSLNTTDTGVQGEPLNISVPGSYLWFDGTNWNLRFDNSGGVAPATFTGSVTGGANTGGTVVPNSLALVYTTLASADYSLTTNSTTHIMTLAWNGSTIIPAGQSAVIVFSSISDPSVFDLEYNGAIQNPNIFLGNNASNPSGSPIVLGAGGTPPQAFIWNGLDDSTGAFVPTQNYTVRLTAEATSGQGVTQSSFNYPVTTTMAVLTASSVPANNFDYLGAATEASVDNSTFFLNVPDPALNHSTVSFTLGKPATVSVFVTGSADVMPNPVTLLSNQLLPAGPGNIHSYPWSGNYPLANSAGKIDITPATSAPLTFTVVATDPDQGVTAVPDVEQVPITAAVTQSSGLVNANLDVTGNAIDASNGLPVASGDARFYYEIQAQGQRFDPVPVTIVLSATGKQLPVVEYPFVPYSFYVRRHFSGIEVQPVVKDSIEYGWSSHSTLGFCDNDTTSTDSFTYNNQSNGTLSNGNLVTIPEPTGSSPSYSGGLEVDDINTGSGNLSHHGTNACIGSNTFFFYVHHKIGLEPPLANGESSATAWDNVDTGYYQGKTGWGHPDSSFVTGRLNNSSYASTSPLDSTPNAGGYGHFNAETWNGNSGKIITDVNVSAVDAFSFDDWNYSLLVNRYGPWLGLLNAGLPSFNNLQKDFTGDLANKSVLSFPDRAINGVPGQAQPYLSNSSEIRTLENFIPNLDSQFAIAVTQNAASGNEAVNLGTDGTAAGALDISNSADKTGMKLTVATARRDSLAPQLQVPAGLNLQYPAVLDYPTSPAAVSEFNAAQATTATSDLANMQANQNAMLAGTGLPTSDTQVFTQVAGQTAYTTFVTQDNSVNTLSSSNPALVFDPNNPPIYVPDSVPTSITKSDGSYYGINGTAANYQTGTGAVTLVGELRYDGTQYSFSTEKTVGDLLDTENLASVHYSLKVLGNDPRLAGAQPVTNANGQVQLTLPLSSAGTTWTSAQDTILTDPVTGMLRLNPPMNITFDDHEGGVEPGVKINNPVLELDEPGNANFTYPGSRQAAVSSTSAADNYTFWETPLDDNGVTLLTTSGVPQPNPNIRIQNYQITLKYTDGSLNNAVQVVPIASPTATPFPSQPAVIPASGNQNYQADQFNLRIGSNSVANQMVSITGEADDATAGSFQYYRLYYYNGSLNLPIPVPESDRNPAAGASVSDPDWAYKAFKPVSLGGVLAWWNVAGLQGVFSITLQVVDQQNQSRYAFQTIEVGQLVKQSSFVGGAPYLLQDPYHRMTVTFPASIAATFGANGIVMAVDAMPASLLPLSQPPAVNPILPVLQVEPHMTFDPSNSANDPVINYFVRNEELQSMGIDPSNDRLAQQSPDPCF